MSEVQALYARQPLDSPLARRKLGGGVPVSPLAHVRVRDPETGALLGLGQPGELECAGPSLMVGYYGNEKATAEVITPDGYVRTGDLASSTGDGSFTFLSRMGDVLRLSGFLVNPLEIETPHPEAAGHRRLPDHRRRLDGVRAVSFVLLKPGAGVDEAALIAHCQQQIANYKVPQHVFAIDEFPHALANGNKIQHTKLREMAERLLSS